MRVGARADGFDRRQWIVGVERETFVEGLKITLAQRLGAIAVETPWDALVARVDSEAGPPSVQIALEAFALSIGPVPGIRVPRRAAAGSRRDVGLVAGESVRRAAFGCPARRDQPRAGESDRRSRSSCAGSQHRAGCRRRPGYRPVYNAHDPAGGVLLYATTGVRIAVPIHAYINTRKSAFAGLTQGLNAAGVMGPGPIVSCQITFSITAPPRSTIAHEVFHCLQLQLLTRLGSQAGPTG